MNDPMSFRTALLPIALVLGALPAKAQTGGFLALVENPSMETNYLLLGMAIVQAIVIVTLSGIMKTLGSGGGWMAYLKGRRAGVLVLALVAGGGLEAQAATPGAVALMTAQNLFWYLFAANAVLFLILVAQLIVLKGMVRTLSGKREEEVAPLKADEAPSFADTILQKLTKRPAPEQEKDLLMHHEYDGIRELDNVLPPWWLWLFYGTIIWAVVYLVNVHVIKVWPDQEREYELEMAQAKADVEAYLARQAAAVDENTVVALTDAATLASGRTIFTDFCRACHGDQGEGNAVGPNLTDAYWIHGGSINDVFRTIKYGVVEKGMQSWKTDLSPQQVQAVASYILSIGGSEPPNAKAPEGELWKPAPEPAAQDTASVAVL